MFAMQMADSRERDELVDWIYLHSAANDGRLYNYLVEIETGPHETPVQALNAALALSIFCFLRLPYPSQRYSALQSLTMSRLEPLLLPASLIMDDDLSLWLYFMCAISNTLLVPAPTNWALGVFLHLRAGHRDWQETRQVLEKFLYIEGMEERLMGGPCLPAAKSDGVHYHFKQLWEAE